MKITADYPLYNNLIGKLDGVEFIKEYLNSLYLENLFCKKFSEDKIKYLLYGYSHDYKELIINIFEIVLLISKKRYRRFKYFYSWIKWNILNV